MSYRKMLRLVGLVAILALSMTFMVSAQGQTIAPGDVIEGTAEGAVVPYAFEAAAGDSFVFTIDATFSSLMTVEDANGTIFATDDDLRFTDLPMLFIAPEDGEYTLVVGAPFGEPEGTFTLTMDNVEVAPIAYGDSVSLTPEMVVFYYFIFEGAEGEVVNVYANSDDDDVELRILSPSGAELARDDDNGPGLDPYIRRYILPRNGNYVILMNARFVDSPLETPVTLNLEQTEALPATSDPTSIMLGGEIVGNTEIEVFVFDEAVAGETYRLTIATPRADSRISVDVIQGDDTITDFNLGNFTRSAVDFVARSNSRIFIEIDLSSFGGNEVDFEVSLAPVG